MRLAIGASRGRLIQQLLVEGALLGMLGAGAAIALPAVALRNSRRDNSGLAGPDPAREPVPAGPVAEVIPPGFIGSFTSSPCLSGRAL